MTSEELAKCVSERCARMGVPSKLDMLCTERILGVGHDQYSQGDSQAFEAMSLHELLGMLDDEIADAIVYAEMLSLKIAGHDVHTELRRCLDKITYSITCAYMGSTVVRLLSEQNPIDE